MAGFGLTLTVFMIHPAIHTLAGVVAGLIVMAGMMAVEADKE